jgi:hypothetical protein
VTICVLRHTRNPDQARQPLPGLRVCGPCHRRLDATLTDVADLFALLPALLVPGPGERGTRGKRSHSPAPGNVTVMALTDSRNGPALDGGDVPDVLGVLESWARAVREDLRLVAEGRVSVTGEVDLLRTHLDYVTAQPWVDELDTDVRYLHRALAQVCGEPRQQRIGTCPAEVLDPEPRTCGASLYAPTYGDAVVCGSCEATWERRHWLHLGQMLAQEA